MGHSGCEDAHPDCRECDASSCRDDSWVRDNCACLCADTMDDSSSSDEEPCDACEGGSRFPSAHVSVDVDVGYGQKRGAHHHHGHKKAPKTGCSDKCRRFDRGHCDDVTPRGEWVRRSCPCLCGDASPAEPTMSPSAGPTSAPTTSSPTASPTTSPTASPTTSPTTSPTASPTESPTTSPTASPTESPTTTPTTSPTTAPTTSPTTFPTTSPTTFPTTSPTTFPTTSPTTFPTTSPTTFPTSDPTRFPTRTPTRFPTKTPTRFPTSNPTRFPTSNPTRFPTSNPTRFPTRFPTAVPTASPLSMGPTVEELGCTNSADIAMDKGTELDDVADAEECTALCEQDQACDHAQFTTGWIDWSSDEHTSGGGTVFNEAQALLKCKETTCDDCDGTGEKQGRSVGNGQCSATGCSAFSTLFPNGSTGAADPASTCVSVGPSSCGATHSHSAIECSGNGSLDKDHDSTDLGLTVLKLTTGSSSVTSGKPASCGLAPDSDDDAFPGVGPHGNSCFGPYQDSVPFDALAGDVLSWEYTAASGQDWFEVMVIIYRNGVPVEAPTFRFGDKILGTRVDTYTVGQAGEHFIRFVVGSYDGSGGGALSASMEVVGFKRTDSAGNGYTKCQHLAGTCNEGTIPGSSLASREEASRRRMMNALSRSPVESGSLRAPLERIQ